MGWRRVLPFLLSSYSPECSDFGGFLHGRLVGASLAGPRGQYCADETAIHLSILSP